MSGKCQPPSKSNRPMSSTSLKWCLLITVSCLPLSAFAQAPLAVKRRATLAERVLAIETAGSVEKMAKEYRAALLAHEVLRLTGEQALTELSANPKFPQFLNRFLSDGDWMTAYLTSGAPIAGTPRGLAVLMELWL